MDMRYESGKARAQIDQQIGSIYLLGHVFEKTDVIVKISACHQTHFVEVGCKDEGIFVDGPILDDGHISLPDIEHLLIPAIEEIDLKIERPALHIIIEIAEVRILGCILIMHLPAVMLS
jgi:hypothetical protein